MSDLNLNRVLEIKLSLKYVVTNRSFDRETRIFYAAAMICTVGEEDSDDAVTVVNNVTLDVTDTDDNSPIANREVVVAHWPGTEIRKVRKWIRTYFILRRSSSILIMGLTMPSRFHGWLAFAEILLPFFLAPLVRRLVSLPQWDAYLSCWPWRLSLRAIPFSFPQCNSIHIYGILIRAE